MWDKEETKKKKQEMEEELEFDDGEYDEEIDNALSFGEEELITYNER